MSRLVRSLSWTLAPVLLAGGGGAWAGPAFFAGRYADGRLEAGRGQAGGGFSVLYSSLSAEIGGGFVQLREETRVAGPATGTLRSVAVVALPAGARAQDVVVRIDGAAAGPGFFLDEAGSRKLYASIGEATGSGRILSRTGRPAWVVPGVELGARADVTVELRLPLSPRDGLWQVDLPMPAADLAREPARRATVEARLHAGRPLRAVFSPTHDVEVERLGLNDATVRLTASDVSSGDDLRLSFVADETQLGLRVLTHRLPDEEAGYFLVLGNPGAAAGDAEDKDLLLVVDASGSMRGEKLEQARAAVEYCLEHLGPADRFNVITFGTEVRSFAPELQPARRDRIDAARAFLEATVARGRTNIDGALTAGLAGTSGNRPRIMVFVTDGAPTAGELDPDRIVAAVPGRNSGGTRVFALGVGDDVDTHLLDRVAGLTGGSSEYAGADEDLDVKVASLYDRVRSPVLADVELDLGGLVTDAVLPAKVPTLFSGQDLFVLGRFRGGGAHEVTVRGTRRGARVEHRVTAVFPEQPDQDNAFVAGLWAARRVGDLLRRLRLDGPDEALVEEVVRLCREFGILTEYTDFLAQADLTAEEAIPVATARLGDANVHSSGAWAVRQSGNEQALRDRKVSSDRANKYVDRQGKKREATRIRQVGRKTFYRRGERWVQGGKGGEASGAVDRRVKRFSPEYFDLVKKDGDFAKAQSLDGPMELELGDQRVEVY